MEIYRTLHGPFPGCPSYDALQRMYRIALPNLSADVAECSSEELRERDLKMFFPKSEVYAILKKEEIQRILDCKCDICGVGRESNLSRFQDLVNWVANHARLLLAILIYLGHTHLINTFKARGFRDDDLHAVITFISDEGRCPINLFPGFKKSYQATLDLFKPPIFVMGDPEFNYDDHQRFPYLNDTDFAKGSFGQVRRFEIHPDYLDPSVKMLIAKYTSPSASNTENGRNLFARKILKYTLSASEFDMEVQTLKIINDQKHNNIIDVIAFYSWRGELNCVFPFVALNLHDILYNGKQPEALAQTGRFPNHWLWLQMIEVADALKTIHNPPNQLRPDLGTVVGFHFDLKPRNILVTPDGTLKITDFGQSMVKMVQENEAVYGTFVGGDFAYGPPETSPSRSEVNALRSVMLPTLYQSYSLTNDLFTPPSSPSRRTSSKTYSLADSLDIKRHLSLKSVKSPAFQLPGDSSTESRRGSDEQSIAAPSVAATSTASEDPQLTVTANYDVWSLACIVTEVLVFIFLGGADKVTKFEQARKAAGNGLSFHHGKPDKLDEDCLKICVHGKLDALRDLNRSDATTTPGQVHSYLSETTDLIRKMFRSDPKLRFSSAEVVDKLKEIREKYPEESNSGLDIIQHMKSLVTPRNFRELGYLDKDTVVPFYNMTDVQLEVNYQPVVDCRLQLFRNEGAIHVRACYGEPPRTAMDHTFDNSGSFYCPLYMFDANGRNICRLADSSITIILHFGSQEDLIIFQTAMTRHKPYRGVKVSDVTLHSRTRHSEPYTNLFNRDNPWPRCQFWLAEDSLYVTPQNTSTNRGSADQVTPVKARSVLFFGPSTFFGIPLHDGKKMIKEERDSFLEHPKKITITKPDNFFHYFHLLRPDFNSHKLPTTHPPYPVIPLNLNWLRIDERDESKRANRVDITFTNHTDLIIFHGLIKEANKYNPYPINEIPWRESVQTPGKGSRNLPSRKTSS